MHNVNIKIEVEKKTKTILPTYPWPLLMCREKYVFLRWGWRCKLMSSASPLNSY